MKVLKAEKDSSR